MMTKRARCRAILIEQDEHHCQLIATRLEKVEPVITEHIKVETPPLMEVAGA